MPRFSSWPRLLSDAPSRAPWPGSGNDFLHFPAGRQLWMFFHWALTGDLSMLSFSLPPPTGRRDRWEEQQWECPLLFNEGRSLCSPGAADLRAKILDIDRFSLKSTPGPLGSRNCPPLGSAFLLQLPSLPVAQGRVTLDTELCSRIETPPSLDKGKEARVFKQKMLRSYFFPTARFPKLPLTACISNESLCPC